MQAPNRSTWRLLAGRQKQQQQSVDARGALFSSIRHRRHCGRRLTDYINRIDLTGSTN